MKQTRRNALVSLLLVIVMVASLLPLGILTASAATITATTGWDTGASTLYVNSAADLGAVFDYVTNKKELLRCRNSSHFYFATKPTFL